MSDTIAGMRLVNSRELARRPHTPEEKFHLQRIACEGKVAYASRHEAQKAIDGFRRRKKNPRAKGQGSISTAYKCRGCHAWHLSSK